MGFVRRERVCCADELAFLGRVGGCKARGGERAVRPRNMDEEYRGLSTAPK